MTHTHCDKCFITNCFDTSSCPLIYCPNGCFARMHECKRNDHEHICPNAFIPCINVNYGCPLTIRRSQLTRHLRVCPASITICSYEYNHNFYFNKLEDGETDNLIQKIARRDNTWNEHLEEFKEKQKEMYADFHNKNSQDNPNDHVIRSGKYRYITMPECVLAKRDGVICSTCVKHLRQLEENEEQRLSELSEEEQQMMADFNLHYDYSSDPQLTHPSLVKMSSTLINSTDISTPTTSSLSQLSATSSITKSLPVITDAELPTSYIYRLNYFSSNKYLEKFKSFNRSPRFPCEALIRRDEIEQHWLIHYNVDCILNTTLIQQCPKAAYGCLFQCERFEPCQMNGDVMRIRFDKQNDAIAFDWYPMMNNEYNGNIGLLDLPSEILEKILLHLDSLSLRNIALVSRRLRALCQDLLPSRGIVVWEYERQPSSHGDTNWSARQKHWLFTNTSSGVPKWRLKTPNKLTSLSQHLITCPYGETKDLQNEPKFQLIGLSNSKPELKST